MLSMFFAFPNPQFILIVYERLFPLTHCPVNIVASQTVVLDNTVRVLPLPIRCDALFSQHLLKDLQLLLLG